MKDQVILNNNYTYGYTTGSIRKLKKLFRKDELPKKAKNKLSLLRNHKTYDVQYEIVFEYYLKIKPVKKCSRFRGSK